MDTKQFIQEFATLIQIDSNKLHPEFDFKHESDWDSLTFISTLALVDRLYGVVLESDSLIKINKVNELVALIEARVS